ncbi:oligosaccharide flippase family protein [Bacteroidia bacterium]|nr:oligosaccharide flippase family protein [Bacteroidia bacterium]MDB9882037.1 oligosaccharide flippase family protein [Bacteroidia bacterium]MDC1395740.1 oligosaccharide flippase family protein [Bacteroidia bacterium]
MSIVKKLAGDTAIYGIPSIVGRSINFVLVFFFASYFTPEFLAPHVEFYAYAAFFFVVLPHGMETAFFNFTRNKEKYKDVFATALSSVSIITLAFVLLMLLNKTGVGTFVGHPDNISYVVLFTVILAIDVIKSIPYALLRYLDKAKKFALVKSLGIVINVGLNIFFIVYYPEFAGVERSIEYIFISNLIASAVELILLSPDVFSHFGIPNMELWKAMFKYSWPLIVLGFAGMINETFDRIIMRKLLPPETVDYEIGVYGTFYKLSMLMTIFIQAFRFAAEPLFFSQADKKEGKSSYIIIMNWFVFACGAIFLFTSLFRKEIAELLIRKPEFHEHPDALFIVPILLLANLFLGIFYNLSIWYKLNNKTRLGALVSVIGATITLALLLVYIPQYGFKAAAITTLIAYFVMTAISYFLGQKHYPISYDVKQVLGLLTLSIGLYIFADYMSLEGIWFYLLNVVILSLYTFVGYRIILSTIKT